MKNSRKITMKMELYKNVKTKMLVHMHSCRKFPHNKKQPTTIFVSDQLTTLVETTAQ